jgi:hypothetical protein
VEKWRSEPGASDRSSAPSAVSANVPAGCSTNSPSPARVTQEPVQRVGVGFRGRGQLGHGLGPPASASTTPAWVTAWMDWATMSP